jgi:phenylalanyl-tRNA synthetase beta chain
VPTFRPDVTRPIDLVEEVARLHGYDRFDASLPSGPSGGLTTEQRRGRLLAAALAGAGLDQAITLPFVSAGDLALFGSDVDDVLRVKNPLREEESRLRPTLLPGLLNAVVYNLSHGAASVALFETGSVFHTASATWDARLPEQPERLGWVINGGFGDRILGQPPRDADVTTSLGVWALLTDALGVDSEVRAATTTGFHPARTAEVTVGGTVIGHIGELSPLIARRYGIDGRVAIAELELTPLLAPAPPSKAKSPSVFPHVEYDLSFNVGDGLPAGEVMRVTRAAAGDLLESAVVFDEFLGLGPGNRAIAIRYRLRAADRTLTADEIGKIRASMIEAAAAAGATLRGA